MSFRLTPVTIISVTGAIGIISTIGYILLAIYQPWLGISFAPSNTEAGIIVVSSEGPTVNVPVETKIMEIRNSQLSMELQSLDLTIEPDGALHTYDIYDDFLERQGKIFSIINSNSFQLIDDGGNAYDVQPMKQRPLSSLPVAFWVPLFVGVTAWFISSAVYAFRSEDIAAKYLLISGASMLVSAPFSAVYATRELAMPMELFAFLSDGNFFGGSLFSASIVALLLYYPKRIGPGWVGPIVIAVFVAWFVAQQLGAFDSMTFARRFLVLLAVIAMFVLAIVHWLKTKHDPVARASLQWFLLSWMLGTSLFWFFILMPQMFGIDTSALQGYAFSLFLLVYGGLAFGITRYKLFALGQWWGNIVLWAFTVLMLVVLDLLFLLALQLSTELSISLALLISGVLWLPLRSFVWGRILGKHSTDQEAVFKQIVDIAHAPTNEIMNEKWCGLLRNMFDPLSIEIDEQNEVCNISNSGQKMHVPAAGNVNSYVLEFAGGGKKLFNSKDINTVEELLALLDYMVESKAAYARGVVEERHRIARDMHDNLGAQLLGALHNPDIDSKDSLIRETLTDLRDIINDNARTGQSFDEMLADLRAETTERLAVAGIELKWQIDSSELSEVTPQLLHAIRSIIREASSNIIKHAGATYAVIKITSRENTMKIFINDNGKGIEESSFDLGHGLENMKMRVTSLNGTMDISNQSSGVSLSAQFPIILAGASR